MKNLYIKLCLLALSAFFAQSLHAYDFAVSGIYYKIISSTDKTVEVTYKSSSYSYYYSDYSGTIVIPNEVTYNSITYNVTSISEYAFVSCTGLTSITIPSSVTSIGSSAFCYCPGLTSVTIPSSVTSIGDDAFRNCTGLTSISIPSSVTSIGDFALYGCTGLTGPVFNSSIFAYLPSNFSGEYSIPEGIKQIVGSAFYGCSGLTSVTIPSSVTSIGSYAFKGCTGLTSVTIPSSVTSIGTSAFKGCAGLTSVTIPSSVTSISSSAFANCTGLTSVTIPSSVTSINYNAFNGCTGLKSVTIPSSVTSIGTSAFKGCYNLMDVALNSEEIVSKSYTTSNSLAGIFGSQVKQYTLGNKITSIGDYAFKDCTGLTSVTIPSSVTSIGYDTFYGCTGLTSVTISGDDVSILDNAFYGAKIYVRNHSNTLMNFWNKGFSNIYDIETKTYIERPYLECTKRTQTSLTFWIRNNVPGYNYSVHLDIKEYKVDDYITVTGLLPETSYSYTLYADDIRIGSSQYTSTSSISRSIGATNITASSFTLNGTCKTGDAELQSTSITVDGKTFDGNSVTFTGLRPSKEYTVTYTVEASGKTVTTSTTVTTSSLTLTTAQPKVISAGNVLVSAETNIDPAETNVGFEWRRTDWTDDFASNTGKGYVNGESMEGKIKNLYTEKLWKYRPYYKSNDGTYYYGNWVGIDPTNTSWFEPTVHTYADFSVDGNTVLLKGYTLSGTDNVTEQGFKYWKSGAAAAKGTWYATTVDAASVPADAQTVAAAGELMSAELTGLDYNSVYYYAAYVKTSTGETFYGEQRSFTIGENPTGIISVKEAEEQDKSAGTRPIMAGWFTLDGRKLQTAPTRSGIYIHNGKKISLR